LSHQGHPDDILPLLLTSVTQELFSCIADEHVTGESPYKLLKKDDIVQDMKKRAAVSDFSPAKQIVLEYPDEELLLVYDKTFTYGQCFYLVLTPEAKDRLLKPPSPEVKEVLEEEEKVPSGPRQWIGLGSEREIEEESVKETRNKLQYTFSRERRKFGLPVCFSDRSAADARAGLVDCVSYQDSSFSIRRVQQERAIQAIPELRSSSAQTQYFSNLFQPQLVLEGPDDVLAFEFCPSDPNIIVGGCINGQVALWDISANVTVLQATDKKVFDDSDKFDLSDNKEDAIPVIYYCAVSTLQNKHQGAITDIKWLPPAFTVTDTGIPVQNPLKMSVQVLTCSLDCRVFFTATSQVSLSKIDASGEYVPLRFSLEHYACNGEDENVYHTMGKTDFGQDTNKTLEILKDVNTKLYIGTEDGEIVYTDWTQGKEESDQGTKPLHCFQVHHWMVNTVQRSPFFKNIILTVGEWNFAIWREEVMEGPIILSANSEQTYSAGCWSLSKPAVFFIGKKDGSIEVWNLVEKANAPVHIQDHLSNAKITCMKPWTFSSRQHFLAVTDDDGLVRILEIPKQFYVRSRNEVR
ncbi:unnamed protein product, partial [Tetraodon nigroviridis]